VFHLIAGTVAHLLEMRSRARDGAIESYDQLLALAVRKVDEVAPLNVSKAAHEKADELRLGDLRTYCWNCTGSYRDGSPKPKRLFVWEHHKRAADIRNEVVALPKPTVEQIAAILATTRIAWILRNEDDRLGPGRKPRPDPARAYRDADIALLYRWEECRPVNCTRHRRG
jgi:hypothetical protein